MRQFKLFDDRDIARVARVAVVIFAVIVVLATGSLVAAMLVRFQ